MALPQQRKKINKKPELPSFDEIPNTSKKDIPQEDDIKELTDSEVQQAERKDLFSDYPTHTEHIVLPEVDTEIQGTEESPFFEEPKQSDTVENDDKFVDKKDMKIIPIGGKKARAKDFDKRKNSLTPLKLFRLLLIIVILVLFGLGIKNTFYPNNNYSKAEISNIAQTAVGQTGFPLEKGKAFAENFLDSFLQFDESDTSNQQLMAYFYGEGNNSVANEQVLEKNGFDNKQHIIIHSKVFDTINTAEDTTLYKLSAFVSDENGNEKNPDSSTAGHWVSFAVNVYYNKKNDSLNVDPSSPIRIPTYAINNNHKNPKEAKIGNGTQDDNMKSKLFPTIAGFVKAYTSSSMSSHNDILQYIDKTSDTSLTNGFGGDVQLASESDDESIENIVIYDTDSKNEWKADITINLKESKEANSVTYKSRYIITIKKNNAGKYVVTKFAPYLYITDNEEN